MEEGNRRVEKINENLKLYLKIYGFPITFEKLVKIAEGLKGKPIPMGVKTYWTNNASFRKIERLFTNSRETLKLVLFEDGSWLLLNKEIDLSYLPYIDVPYGRKNLVFQKIQEGYYLLTTGSYYGDRVVCLTDCQTSKEVKEFIETYKEMEKIQAKYSYAREFSGKTTLFHDGLVSLETLKEKLKEFQEIARKIEEAEKEEKRRLEEAYKKRLTLEEGESSTKVSIKGLDGHTYRVEISPPPLLKKEKFKDFIYLHRYRKNELQGIQKTTLWASFWEFLIEQTDRTLKISIDKASPVELKFLLKKRRGGSVSTLAYLDGKRVSRDDLFESLEKYFFLGESLTFPEKKKIRESLTLEREKALLNKGITGRLYDLEGEVPVQLFFTKEKKHWYLVIGEYKYYIKGGRESIKRLESVLRGTTTRRGRYSTTELFRRLSEILGEKDSLEIIEQIKAYGKLLKGLKGGN